VLSSNHVSVSTFLFLKLAKCMLKEKNKTDTLSLEKRKELCQCRLVKTLHR